MYKPRHNIIGVGLLWSALMLAGNVMIVGVFQKDDIMGGKPVVFGEIQFIR